MVQNKETKEHTKDGFYELQIDQGGKFTYLCCKNCKPYIDKEYKNLKIDAIKEEFFTTEEFKKLNPKTETPRCSYCEKVFYYFDTKEPVKRTIKRSESKQKRWNRVLAKYYIDQKRLLNKCSKYGKKRAEEFLLSNEALWELAYTIQQKCRNFIEKKEKNE